jgi:hypothetical protein
MRKSVSALAALAMTLPMALATPASAHDGYYGNRYGYNRYDAGYDQGPREWRGEDGRYYCRRSDGTVGLIIGGAGGALLGRAVDTRGSRATGTILGLAAGALIGREIAKKRRCR